MSHSGVPSVSLMCLYSSVIYSSFTSELLCGQICNTHKPNLQPNLVLFFLRSYSSPSHIAPFRNNRLEDTGGRTGDGLYKKGDRMSLFVVVVVG